MSALDAMRAAERALALVAARNSGRIPESTLAAVLDAAVNLQFWIAQEEQNNPEGKQRKITGALHGGADESGASIRNGIDPLGPIRNLHSPAKKAKEKRNSDARRR